MKKNISLKPFNTFGVDAKASYFTEICTVSQLEQLCNNSLYKKFPSMVLGKGSNILFTQNFEGIVMLNSLKGISIVKEDENHAWLRAAAGEDWHDFVNRCLKDNYGGLENLSLIPGSVGAAPIQNIGAYGVEQKDCFYELEAFDTNTLKIVKFNNTQCKFGYRDSIFKHKEKDRKIILSVTYKLTKKQHKINDTYGTIKTELKKRRISKPNIQDLSDIIISIRNSKLPNPEELGNAGSFFKNPKLHISCFNYLKKRHPNISFHRISDDTIKLSAAWFIDQTGWKGKRFGDAGVHKQQPLVLVNYGRATGKEIYALSEQIFESVYEKYHIFLEKEVIIL